MVGEDAIFGVEDSLSSYLGSPPIPLKTNKLLAVIVNEQVFAALPIIDWFLDILYTHTHTHIYVYTYIYIYIYVYIYIFTYKCVCGGGVWCVSLDLENIGRILCT